MGSETPKRPQAEKEVTDWLDFSAEFEIGVGELELKPSEFWGLTPAEFYYITEGFKRRQTRRLNELMYAAWHAAILPRQKEIPPLNSLLRNYDEEPKREQTTEEMMAMCRLLNAVFGGEVIEI